MTPTTPHSTESIWVPIAAPVVWSLHFTVTYIAVSVWCGRFDGRASAVPILGGITLAALMVMGYLFARGWRLYVRHRAAPPDVAFDPYDDNSPADRDRFMGLTTMLLVGLSLLGTGFSTMALLLVRECR